MTISGVALLAICTLLGSFIGDLLGVALGMKANVGGVGIAMLMLIASRIWLVRRGLLSEGLKLGLIFWGALYIPIVVAMAANQNVFGFARFGPAGADGGHRGRSCLFCVCGNYQPDERSNRNHGRDRSAGRRLVRCRSPDRDAPEKGLL